MTGAMIMTNWGYAATGGGESVFLTHAISVQLTHARRAHVGNLAYGKVSFTRDEIIPLFFPMTPPLLLLLAGILGPSSMREHDFLQSWLFILIFML